MLIFLDIDGVMVPAKSWVQPELLSDGFPAFSSQATHVLQNIVSDNTTIMLTTSHKSTYSVGEWKTIFERRGIIINNLKSLPENVNHISRKDEVLNWFNVNNVNEEFVIIDDDKSLNSLPQFLKDNLILTSSLVGLVKYHIEEIKLVLEKKIQTV